MNITTTVVLQEARFSKGQNEGGEVDEKSANGSWAGHGSIEAIKVR